jgi:uncharacterized SAM-binding protein YcdF (DUF218 family)
MTDAAAAMVGSHGRTRWLVLLYRLIILDMPSDSAARSAFLWKLARVAGRPLALVGAAAVLMSAWLMAGGSSGLERLVVEADVPRPATAIVCLTGGIASHGLPTPEGWDRIYTAVQLLADGLAPAIIFSGGGTERVSEAEVYAEAARWLGAPPESILLDPIPGSTAEHPGNLLKLDGIVIRHSTSLLVVTSRLHSKRSAMCFRKSGFSNFRLITSYEAQRSRLARSNLRSAFPSFKPNEKDYGDPLNRLRRGLNDTIVALREILAIGVYRYRGQALNRAAPVSGCGYWA